MIPNIAYVNAWLTMILFRSDSLIYEDAWTVAHRLEDEHTFTAAELRTMRNYVQAIVSVTAI